MVVVVLRLVAPCMSQRMHRLAPVICLYVPIGHGSHSAKPEEALSLLLAATEAASWYPGIQPQAEKAVLPGAETVLLGHGRHGLPISG